MTCGRLAVAAALVLTLAGPAAAANRFVLIVTGAPGSDTHARDQQQWADAFVAAVRGPLAVTPERLIVLGPTSGPEVGVATREGVREALTRLAKEMRREDLLFVLLIGHGTFDGIDAKFNLVGPDLEAADWRALLAPVPGQVVFVNAAAASAPFLTRLAGPRRVVITATDTPAQKFDTRFAEAFVAAFTDAGADLDKDGRVSIGEAFTYGSTRTRRWYEQRGQLSTERAMLDDTGDGVGKEAGTLGSDGAVASRLFLDPGPDAALSKDPAVSELVGRRDAIETDIEELKRKKSFMPGEDYERELERMLVDLARLSRQIRRSQQRS